MVFLSPPLPPPRVDEDSNVLLVGIRSIRRFIQKQRRCTSVIKEVDGHRLITTVGGGQPAIEIRHQVDLGAVELSLGQEERRPRTAHGPFSFLPCLSMPPHAFMPPCLHLISILMQNALASIELDAPKQLDQRGPPSVRSIQV